MFLLCITSRVKSQLLHTAYAAAGGGYRSSLDLFDNGQIVYATWQSL